MEDRRVKASARLAVVVRNFMGSRVERELLARAFVLAAGGAAPRAHAALTESSAAVSPAVLRKGA